VPELARLESRPLRPLLPETVASTAGLPPPVSSTHMAAAGKRRIDLKLLLITATGDEPSYLAARSAMDRIGVSYTALIAATTPLTPALLSNNLNTCYYRGVVIAVGGLGFKDPQTQLWGSAFTAEEWAALADYERACSARELVWYGAPSADYGLALASDFASNEVVTAQVTSAGKGVFPYVAADAAIQIHDSFGYKSTVTDQTATTALVQSDDGFVLAAQHLGLDGREALIVTVDSNPYLLHGLVWEYGLISWVSHGVFLGKKRAYLSPQIDDVFISDDRWNTTSHRNNVELDGQDEFRITGPDIDNMVSWQTAFRAKLPAGSQYITALAFNGVGTDVAEYPDESLLTQALAAGGELTWLNHTWDHENFDPLAQDAVHDEVTRNCDLATQHNLNGFACAELVSPDMSGLTSAAAMLGLVDAGARYVVSDTSITAEVAATRGTTAGDNPSFNVGRINTIDDRVYQVPRHPTSIFYDVATRNDEVDEYNTIYRGYWGRDLSYDEIIDTDATFGLHYLLTGDIDPVMWHQTNLYSELIDGTSHSLFSDWVESAATRYSRLVTFPIRTLAQRDIAAAMQARAAFDACGAVATYVELGVARRIELRATGTCVVPMTGVSSRAGKVDLYGGVPTTELAITAGATKVIRL